MPTGLCRERGLIKRHFRGDVSSGEEGELRAHLPACAACRGYYDRFLLHARLTRSGRSPSDRLAIGLGLHPAPAQGVRALLAPWPLAGVAAAVALLLVLGRGTLESPASDFGARGAATPSRSALEIYRVPHNQKPAPVEGVISPDDELAFAYRNPLKYKHLLVFGIDDARTVYWFHPAWNGQAATPVAISIAPGVGPHELGEAVRHDLREGTLRVIGLFTNSPLSVAVIEERIRRGALDLPNAERSETKLKVGRALP